MNNIQSHTKYGLLAGAILIVIKYILVVSFPGISFKSTVMEYLAGIIILGAVIYYAVTTQRKENGGVTTFKEVFFIGIYVSFVTALLVGCFQFVYAKYIDPARAERMVQITIEYLKSFKTPEKQIAAAEARASVFYTPGGQFQSGMTTIVYGLFVTLVVALTVKKDTRYTKLENQ